MATTAAANIAESIGSLFGSNKVKTLERENTALHREVADPEETIEYHAGRPQPKDTGNAVEARQGDRRQGNETQRGNIVSEKGNRKGSIVSLPA